MRIPFINIGVTAFLILACYLMLNLLQMKGMANDPGVGWHLKTGEVIAATAVVPRTDPFLAGEARPWISDQWLSDLVFFRCYQYGGWPLVYALCTMVFFGAFLVVLFPAIRAETGSAVIAAFSVLLGFKIAQVHFIVRPVIFSFLFFAIEYRILLSARRIISQGRHPYLLYFSLIPLMALWANMHPSFVMGGLLLGCFLVALAWNSVVNGQYMGISSPTSVALLFFAVAGLATIANPYGLDLHRSIMALNESRYFMRLHLEWRGIDFRNPEGLLVEGFALILVFGLAVGGVRNRLRAFDWLALIVYVHFALLAVRGLPYLGIVIALPLSQALIGLHEARFFSLFKLGKKILDGATAINNRENRTYAMPVVYGFFLLPLFSVLMFQRMWPYSGAYGPSEDRYSFKALEAIKGAANGQPINVLNHSNFGGFITWYGAPLLRAVHDDRNTLLGEAFYKRMAKVLDVGEEYKAMAKDAKAEFLMIYTDSSQTKYLKATGGSVFYADDVATVFDLRGLTQK